MVRAGVSNLGLDTVGMLLLSTRSGSAIVRSSRRGSAKAVGVGGERCVGPATDERWNGGVSIVQRWRWRRRRRQVLDAATFRATAADDVEKEGAVVEEEELEAKEAAEAEAAAVAAASSSERLQKLSSRKVSKISKIELRQQQQQQQQRMRAGKQVVPRRPGILSNLVEEWVTREKGDVRDVVLMSLTFAVLIYISQHLVQAYCTLRHMYFNHY